MIFHQLDDLLALDLRVLGELLARRVDHVDVDLGHRAKAAALDQNRLLAQHLGWLQDLARGAEHRRAGQPELHELQGHHAVVDVAELDPRELDHVDLDALGREAVEQRFDDQIGLVMQGERREQQVDADDAERLLLERVLVVEHAHVDGDLAVLVARMRLVLDAHPAVALVGALEAARRDRVGEGEEGRVVAALDAQPLEVEIVLVVEHALQALARDIAVATPVDGVGDLHVVGRDRLGDGPGRGADLEEPAGDLLPGADLGEGPVAQRVEVDAQGLLVGVELGSLLLVEHHVLLSRSAVGARICARNEGLPAHATTTAGPQMSRSAPH